MKSDVLGQVGDLVSAIRTVGKGNFRMLSMTRSRLTYVNVVSTLALVFAMSGGAYAASKFLITSTKQIKPSVLKQLKGNTGARGAQGAAGSQGPTGLPAPAGPQGPAGAKGENGTAGTPGKDGKDGSPWTVDGTLPSSRSLSGEWGLVASAAGGFEHLGTSVSFNIPLKEAPTAHYIRTTGMEPFYNEVAGKEEERAPTGCNGSAVSPTAEPGNLCVYASIEENTATNPLPNPNYVFPKICAFATGGDCTSASTGKTGADSQGFGVITLSKEEGVVNVAGTWAVTAE
jgi:hypothetical protein